MASTNQFAFLGLESPVELQGIGAGTSRTAQIVLAGVVGLLAVGLILLAVGMLGRRGSDPEAPATARGKTEAGVS